MASQTSVSVVGAWDQPPFEAAGAAAAREARVVRRVATVERAGVGAGAGVGVSRPGSRAREAERRVPTMVWRVECEVLCAEKECGY